jgi:branched-chain amino acid aminotransferase
VIEIATNNGMVVQEIDLTTYDLYTADEVFTTGSARGILPIIRIDGREIGEGVRGQVTKTLQKHYKKTISEK